MLYALLWIAEGALRKWVVAGGGGVIYMANGLLILFLGSIALIFPLPASVGRQAARWVVIARLLGSWTALMGAISAIHASQSLTLITLGLSQYLGLITGVCLFGCLMSTAIRRRLELLVLTTIPLQFTICALQAVSPQTSFINRVGPEAYQDFVNANGVVRTTGTFTSPAGLAGFLALALAVTILIRCESGTHSSRIRILAGWMQGLVVLTVVISGSRGSVFFCGLILLASSVGSRGRGFFLQRLVFGAAGLAVLVAVGAWAFPLVVDSFATRFADASRSESLGTRVYGLFLGAVDAASHATPLGDGMAVHTQAGIQLAQEGTWIEEELERWVAELGLFGLLAALGRQMLGLALMVYAVASRRRTDARVLFVLTAAAVPPLLAGQINTQASVQGAATITLGMLLSRMVCPDVRRED